MFGFEGMIKNDLKETEFLFLFFMDKINYRNIMNNMLI